MKFYESKYITYTQLFVTIPGVEMPIGVIFDEPKDKCRFVNADNPDSAPYFDVRIYRGRVWYCVITNGEEYHHINYFFGGNRYGVAKTPVELSTADRDAIMAEIAELHQPIQHVPASL
jgi:hypothetical protein